MSDEFLTLLDRERGAGLSERDLVRELSPDGSQCTIIYSHFSAGEIDAVIVEEMARAKAEHYRLEWKVYGHDGPPNLKDRLLAAGFEAEPAESLMVLPVSAEAVRAFESSSPHDIRRLEDPERLADVAEISREIGRKNVDDERRRLAMTMEQSPDEMSVYVAYVEGEPVSCGRIYFKPGSELAELCGGRTKTAHRNRGLYSALVAARLKEAMTRQRKFMFVDALPTSEPILKKRGFRAVTSTQPYVYE